MLAKVESAVGVRDVTNALCELGFLDGGATLSDLEMSLEDDLGLDSQEMVSLVEIVSSLVVCLDPLDDHSIDKVNDLVIYLAANRDSWLPEDVPYVLQGSVEINQGIESVFEYIADFKKWPSVLAHVAGIESEYDDSSMQSFKMHIDELGSNENYAVQSWRYVNREMLIIDFSQPVPPAGFRVHKGGWRFQAIDENHTRLISYHGFSVTEESNADRSIALIRKHINAALKTWAAYGNRTSK